MDLVDMGLELVTDQVAVMVQDQGLDMGQVLGVISVLANMFFVFSLTKRVEHLDLNHFCVICRLWSWIKTC